MSERWCNCLAVLASSFGNITTVFPYSFTVSGVEHSPNVTPTHMTSRRPQLRCQGGRSHTHRWRSARAQTCAVSDQLSSARAAYKECIISKSKPLNCRPSTNASRSLSSGRLADNQPRGGGLSITTQDHRRSFRLVPDWPIVYTDSRVIEAVRVAT
jgi:hypothetical protein